MRRGFLARAALLAGVATLAACGGHAATASDAAPRAVSTTDAAPAVATAHRSPIPSGTRTTFDYTPAGTGVGPARTGIPDGFIHDRAASGGHL